MDYNDDMDNDIPMPEGYTPEMLQDELLAVCSAEAQRPDILRETAMRHHPKVTVQVSGKDYSKLSVGADGAIIKM